MYQNKNIIHPFCFIFIFFTVTGFHETGATPLHEELDKDQPNIEKVTKLLSEGADVNAPDKFGHSPLHKAVQKGRKDIVSLLLQSNKVEVDKQGSFGFTPLYYAVGDGQTDIAELLLQKGADVSKQPSGSTMTILQRAIYNNHAEMIKLLLQHTKGKDGSYVLPWAMKNHKVDIAKLLIDRGADVNNQDNDDKLTPLHLAIKAGFIEVIPLLLEKEGIDINRQDTHGRTPLYYAIEDNGTDNIVASLLGKGADVNRRESFWHYTPLHLAVTKGKENVAKLLLQKGADVNQRDRRKITPLEIAQKEHPEMVSLFQSLPSSNTDAVGVNKENEIGIIPLKEVSAEGHSQITPLLQIPPLSNDVNKKNKIETIPLNKVAGEGRPETVLFSQILPISNIDSGQSAQPQSSVQVLADNGQDKSLQLQPQEPKQEPLSSDQSAQPQSQSSVQGPMGRGQNTQAQHIQPPAGNGHDASLKSQQQNPKQEPLKGPVGSGQSTQPQSPVQELTSSSQNTQVQHVRPPAGDGQDAIKEPEGDDQDTKTLFTTKNLMIAAPVAGVLALLLYKVIKKKAEPKVHEEEDGGEYGAL